MGRKIYPPKRIISLFKNYHISLLLFLSTNFIENILIESNDTLIVSSIGIIVLLILAKITNAKKKIANLNLFTDFFLLAINFFIIGKLFWKIIPQLNIFSNLLEILCGQGLFIRSYYYKSSGFISVIAFSVSFFIKFEIQNFQLSFNLISICLIMCMIMIKRENHNNKEKYSDISKLHSSDLFFVLDENLNIISTNQNFTRFLDRNPLNKDFFSNLLKNQITVKKEYLYKADIKEIISDLLNENGSKNTYIFENYMKAFHKRKEKNLFAIANIDFLQNKNEVMFIWKKKKGIYVVIKQDRCLNESLNMKTMIKNYTKAIYYIAHELRNPLSCILNLESIDSINKDSFENINAEYIQPAIVSSKLMLNLVNGLLDIGQIETGTFKLAITDFDLKALLEEVFKIIQFQVKNRGIKMKIEIDPQIKMIKSDPNHVKQIIINLLSIFFFYIFRILKIMIGNAMKYTTHGKILLKAKKMNSSQIQIIVKDTGLGIQEENLKKLFNAFSRIRNQEDSYLNSQGVGLGLLISNNLANLLNKSEEGISVTSSYKCGSEFSFKIYDFKNDEEILTSSRRASKPTHSPCKLLLNIPETLNLNEKEKNPSNAFLDKSYIKNEEIKIQISINDCLNEKNSSRKTSLYSTLSTCKSFESFSLINNRIEKLKSKMKKKNCDCPTALIVDDDEFNILTMKTRLKKFEMSCETAFSGTEALDKIFKMQQNNCCKFFKFIFLDLEMPKQNGTSIYGEISQFYKNFEKVDSRIILNTGYSNSSDIVKEAAAKGLKNILIKPITQISILNAIDPL